MEFSSKSSYSQFVIRERHIRNLIIFEDSRATMYVLLLPSIQGKIKTTIWVVLLYLFLIEKCHFLQFNRFHSLYSSTRFVMHYLQDKEGEVNSCGPLGRGGGIFLFAVGYKHV